MTWFLKSKIRKQKKIIEGLDKSLKMAVLKYNDLVEEFQGQNFFSPIGFQQPGNDQPKPEEKFEGMET